MASPVEMSTPEGVEVVLFRDRAETTLLCVDNLLVVRGVEAELRRAVSDPALAAADFQPGDESEERAHAIRAQLLRRVKFDPAVDAAVPVGQLNVANTTQCNMRCSYCYHHLAAGADAPRTKMSVETAHRMVDALLEQAGGMPTVSILFLGGESLVQKELVEETVAYAAERQGERRVKVVVYTNGLLIDRTLVEWSNDNTVSLVVSLDGPPSLHDRHRVLASGAPTAEKVLANIQLLMQHTRHRLRRVRAVAAEPRSLLPLHRYLVDLGFNEMQVQPAYDTTGMAGRDHVPDLRALCDWYRDLLIEGRVVVIEPFVTILRRLTDRGRGISNWYPCGAGVSTLGVTPNGDLTACHHFVEEDGPFVGNVAEGIPSFSERSSLFVPITDREACMRCWARHLCGGECYHRAQTAGQGYEGVVEASCVEKRELLHAAVEMFTDVAAARPQSIQALLAGHATVSEPNPAAFAARDLSDYV